MGPSPAIDGDSHDRDSPRSARLDALADQFQEDLRVTITKPADMDPPYIYRKGEPLEVKELWMMAATFTSSLRWSRSNGFLKTPRRPDGEVVHWQAEIPVAKNTKRFRQRLWVRTIVHNDRVYITATRAWDRAGRTFGLRFRPLVEQRRASAR